MTRPGHRALLALSLLTLTGCSLELTPSGGEASSLGGFELSRWSLGLQLAGGGFVAGALCALWAQWTRRNAWLWFFLGWFFAPVTLLVLLWKNSRDQPAPPRHERSG